MEFTVLWTILIIQCVFVVTLLSYLFSAFREPIYTASASIILEDVTTQSTLLRAIGLEDISNLLSSTTMSGGREAMFVEIMKIRSKGVLEEVIRRLDLRDEYSNPVTIAALRRPPSIFRWKPQRGMKVQQISHTNAMLITSYSPDREEAKRIAETVIDVYKEQDISARHAETQSAAEFVLEQSMTAKELWTVARSDLEKFQREAGVVDLTQEMQLLIQQIAELRAEREMLLLSTQEIVYNDTAGHGTPSIGGVTFSQMQGILALRGRLSELETELQGKLTQYTDNHPQVKLTRQQIDDIRTQLSSEEEMYTASSQVRLDGLMEQLEEYQDELKRLPRLINRFSELTLAASVYENLYEMLTEMKYRLDISTAMQLSKIRLIEPPWKSSMYSPKVRRNTFLAFALSLVLAVGLALFIEYLDDTIKDEDEVKALFQLPVLGAIPLIGKRDSILVTSERTTKPLLHLRETMNTLAYNIKLEGLDHPIKQILVTSSIPTEGKSSIAVNLALTMARNGQKILLIDADYPRASLRKILEVENHRGLTEVLTGEVSLEEAVHQVGVDGCHLLTSGQRPANPLTLLDSQRMVDFIRETSQKYDLMIFDTPPVLHHNATLALAARTDRTLFVISANQGSRKVISKALEILTSAKVKLVGAALNRIKAGEGYYYYYYYYYGDDTGKKSLWRRIKRIFKSSKHRHKRSKHRSGANNH